jgi:hypothetical protein
MLRLLSIALLAGSIVSCTDTPSTQQSSNNVDSLSYETITMMQSIDGCDKSTKGCTYIEFTYPQFTNVGKTLADSMNMLIQKNFGDPEKNITSPDSAQQDFIAAYKAFRKKEKDYSTPWSVEKNLSVINQNPKWLTLQYDEYTFTGGAHPNSYKLYSILEKTTGRKMILTDFFDSTSIYKLMGLGETEFRSAKGINPNQSLEEAGYWFEENRFHLNNNFYLNENGITFYYNTYEVGPYVVGATEITIPANKLVKLMKN